MPGSVSLFHTHALLESDYVILSYILHFALCRGPRGAAWHNAISPKYAPGCAIVHVLMVSPY